MSSCVILTSCSRPLVFSRSFVRAQGPTGPEGEQGPVGEPGIKVRKKPCKARHETIDRNAN